ncbi:MAG: DNA/RNA nuclease SfsA [Alphaproteobacteria bacterium]|nr:DNA/RNA nuclease SfsA [Alphaproteobacteria bacterium]
MKFSKPLIKATLIRRYKRFLADMMLEDGHEVTAHCANPGAMLGIALPGSTAWLSQAPEGSKRKLAYSWEIVETEGIKVGINTSLPNLLVAEALEKKLIPDLSAYELVRKEVKYGTNSRIDFLLEGAGVAPCYLEVKNVHLKREQQAQFPDCVTERGTKHLNELARMVENGARAILLYIVQRNDCLGFSIAEDLDPLYAQAAREACNNGVESICYQCNVQLSGIEISTRLS